MSVFILIIVLALVAGVIGYLVDGRLPVALSVAGVVGLIATLIVTAFNAFVG